MQIITLTLTASLVLAMANASAGQEPQSSKAFAGAVQAAGGHVDFVFGDERPFPQCHASTVVQAASGEVVSAFFAGTKEKDPDVGIWWSVFENGAWRPVARIAKVNDTAHWNPVLFRDEKDALHLFFKVGPEIPYWQTYWMSSADNGKTWSGPVELVPNDKGGRGPVRNQPIVLANGDWLAPASTEIGRWESFADHSADGGKTWNRTPDFPVDIEALKGKGAIQPAFWESKPGHVHALLRTHAGKVWRTDSEDSGWQWSPVYETPLPNNNSGIDIAQLDDGRILLVYNPVGENWGPRTPLDLAVSSDNGETWRAIAHLEDDPDQESEYSYPCITRTEEGVAISYTWNRKRVRCWQIPLDLL